MNVDEALRQFADGSEFPDEAMKRALEHWETASPRFVSKLRAFAAGELHTEAAEDQIFIILHLCGEKGETRAYEPLCRLIAEDSDIEDWLGDASTETLPGILINVFDGDLEPLLVAIESPRGEEYSRASALAALGYLVRARGVLSDEDMRAYLRRLRREAPPRDLSIFWTIWAATGAALGYDDLRIDVAMLTKDEFVENGCFTLEDFDRTAGLAHKDPAGFAGFHSEGVHPLEDAIGALETWMRPAANTFDEDPEYLDSTPFEGPYVNPLRDVGRNDPCPCGSGKKYKKCCLAA